MTVAELIAELQQFPPDMVVQIPKTAIPTGMRNVHTVRKYKTPLFGVGVIHIA